MAAVQAHHAAAAPAGDPGGADLPDARRAADLRPPVRPDRRYQRDLDPVADRPEGAHHEQPDRLRLRAVGADVRDRHGGLVHLHQGGGREHPIAGGGGLMEAHAMDRVATEPRVAEARGPRRNWLRPVLMTIAVFAIIVFCLFPFYWLIIVS